MGKGGMGLGLGFPAIARLRRPAWVGYGGWVRAQSDLCDCHKLSQQSAAVDGHDHDMCHGLPGSNPSIYSSTIETEAMPYPPHFAAAASGFVSQVAAAPV